MRRRHLRGVMAIERQVYARPWSPNLFVAEMTEPNNRCYLVARIDKTVVGYGGLICYGDEAHVTNIAVDPQMHRHKIGTRVLHELMVQSIELGARAVSLEVRVTNWGAQRLYGRSASIRWGSGATTTRSSTRTRLIMWTDDVRTPAYGRRLASIVAELAGDGAPLVITLGIETSCDETAVAVVEDGFSCAPT